MADRSVGYKWKTASCVEANDYFCALREPICHPGYTWLPDIPSSCFKITRDAIQSMIDFVRFQNNTFNSGLGSKLNLSFDISAVKS